MRPSRVTAASIRVMRLGPELAGRKVLDAIFDPFHRTPRNPRGDRRKYDIGKHRELDAEAAARVGRNTQPQPGAGHRNAFAITGWVLNGP